MDELESEATINLKSKIEKIITKKAREIFVEIDREKLTSTSKANDKNLEPGADVVSASDTFTAFGLNPAHSTSNRKTGTTGNERSGGNSETLTKGVRFVLDRENCFLMELRVVEKDDVILKQFEKEIKQNGDLNSSKWDYYINWKFIILFKF
jgi:hypothetical protein